VWTLSVKDSEYDEFECRAKCNSAKAPNVRNTVTPFDTTGRDSEDSDVVCRIQVARSREADSRER
jgi:hypothetical protein